MKNATKELPADAANNSGLAPNIFAGSETARMIPPPSDMTTSAIQPVLDRTDCGKTCRRKNRERHPAPVNDLEHRQHQEDGRD